MQITPYHAQYYAYALTQTQTGDKIDRLGNLLINAKIDLNPHQVEAVFSTFKSPLREGVLLEYFENGNDRKSSSKVMVLDKGFNGQDELKTYADRIMKSHGVEDFRTV